jgi:hypothetical protein
VKSVIIYFSVLLLFLFVGFSSVYAGFEEGLAAYERAAYETAFKEFMEAAEQGHAEAQFYLGLMYLEGIGVLKNYAEAFKWFRMAAEQGHAGAQTSLGAMYASGRGVPRDYVMSYMWANLAASQGEETASELRSIAAEEMTHEQINKAQRLSRKFKVKRPQAMRP